MTTHLFALRNRATSIIAIAVLATAVAQVATPTSAAASRYGTALHEGNGLHAKPSIRVGALQGALLRAGYRIGAAGVDGRFGPRTASAVRRLQARAHLEVDGIVGPKTRAALRAGVALPPRTVKPARASSRTPAMPGSASPLRLREASSSPWATLGVGVLGLLIGAACAAELARRRRRRRARIGAYLRPYGLPPDVGPRMPAPAAAASAEAEAEEGAGAEADAAPATSDGVTTGLRPGAAVIGYAAVPAEAGDEHVRSSDCVIERACERSGWRLVEIVHEPDGGRVLERPGLSAALERIHAGTAQGLVVSDARLMSRAADFAALVQRFREEHAPLIALDLGVDTSTREGRRVASALVTLNGWARIASRRNGRVPQEATRPANGAGAHLDREPSPLKDGVTG